MSEQVTMGTSNDTPVDNSERRRAKRRQANTPPESPASKRGLTLPPIEESQDESDGSSRGNLNE